MIYDVMVARRSVRQFKPEAPDRALIERLLDAAITAPSASNKQPWRFVVVSSRSVIANLAAAARDAVEEIARHIEPRSEAAFRAYGAYFTRFEAAPTVIVALYRSLTVLSDLVDDRLPESTRARIGAMEERSGLIGVAMALQNLLLMAQEMGLGASGMTGPLVAADRFRTLLDVPPSWEIAALVPVGFPAENPSAPPRKPVGRVTQWIEERS